MHYSPKVEGNQKIRGGHSENLNEIFMSPERSITRVRYYNQKKQDLQHRQNRSPKKIQLTRHNEREQIKNEIEKSLQTHKEIDPYLANYIKEIKVEPVTTCNTYSQFKEEDYPLLEGEKVTVCQERIFNVNNYYNYIYQLEYNQKIFQFVGDAQKMVSQQVNLKDHQKGLIPLDQSHDQQNLINDKKERETTVIRGMYKSHFSVLGSGDTMRKDDTEVDVAEMYPQHLDYGRRGYSFAIKEKDRQEMQKSKGNTWF